MKDKRTILRNVEKTFNICCGTVQEILTQDLGIRQVCVTVYIILAYFRKSFFYLATCTEEVNLQNTLVFCRN